MSVEESRWQRLLDGLRNGDSRIEQEFWQQYGPALERVADRHLAEGVRRRIGPEDVVQSACRSFMRRARLGQFQLADSTALWRVLCAITITKVREQTRFHLRQKRGLGREVCLEPATDQSGVGFEPVDPQPLPDDAVLFAEHLEHLLGSLDEEERQIVDLKLQDMTNEEVAERLGCSERTVRRILKRLEARLGQQLQTG